MEDNKVVVDTVIDLLNNMLRIFPIPNGGVDTLRFEYILLSDRNQPYVERNGQSIITPLMYHILTQHILR